MFTLYHIYERLTTKTLAYHILEMRGTRLLAPTWAKKPMLTGVFFTCSAIKSPLSQ